MPSLRRAPSGLLLARKRLGVPAEVGTSIDKGGLAAAGYFFRTPVNSALPMAISTLPVIASPETVPL